MSNLTNDELAKLEACQTEQAWNDACRSIKAAHNGRYPDDWYAKIIATGKINQVAARWGSDGSIKIAPLDDETFNAFFGRGKPGFTLVEVMIVVVIVVVFLSAITGVFSSCLYTDTARERADGDAISYVRDLHPDWTEVRAVCQSTDSDGDSYVSCTIAAKDAAGIPRDLAVECRHSVFLDYARGCRPMRTIINTRGVGGYDQR